MTLGKFRKPVKIIIFLILIVAIFQLGLLVKGTIKFAHRHFFIKEKNLQNLYGKDSWVLITGASSGQGKHFALEMAKRGFNLILVGSIRTENTIEEIKNKIDKTDEPVKIEFIEKDFRKAHEANFFEEIEDKIKKVGGNLSGLINNVAHRTAWNPYHESPSQSINDSIIVGTIVQSH